MPAPEPVSLVEVGGAGAAAFVAGLEVSYRAVAGLSVALHGVDASFAPGVLSVVAGPSGSGKSSLLRVLAGLHRPTGGTVHVAGVDLGRLRSGARRRHRRESVGMVLQRPSDNLLDYLTAIEQVEVAARFRGTDPAEAASVLDAVGLAAKADMELSELSGGEQQRVAFAAAAVGSPAVLLADEPTAQLDGRSASSVIESMRSLVGRGTSLIVSSHDAAVIDAADDVVRLANGRVVSA
ncbi:ABC transporter ATP-binding protein [Actinospongicola halichondriae]|uniref:ABC transporter ATP-binding protein n=1 Tax=Actinospongicola halichondriae TaxID=3236844 RepID=UPI003D539FDA